MVQRHRSGSRFDRVLYDRSGDQLGCDAVFMRSLPSRARCAAWIVLVLLPACSPLPSTSDHSDRSIVAGFMAGAACSAIFVAGRAESDIPGAELAGMFDEASSLPAAEVDREGRVVEVFYDPQREPRRAVFRDGRGCTTLPPTATRADTLALPQLPIEPPPASHHLPWPDGDAGIDLQHTEGAGAALHDVLARAFDGNSYGDGNETIGVVVVHRGQLIAERYRPGFGPHTPYRTWSVAKSITGALIGILVERGDLHLDGPAPIPEWGADDPRSGITVRHLLHMSSGLPRAGAVSYPVYFGGADSIAEITRPELEVVPGTRWHYANRDTLLLVRSMRSVLGDERYHRFPYEALLWPIGMRHTTPELDAYGNFVLSSQVQSTARDRARFGLLLAQDGVWKGQRVLPDGWVDLMRTRAPARATGLVGLWRHGPIGLVAYGGQTWLPGGLLGLPDDTFAALGSRGQAIVVVPSRDLVVVRTGLDDEPGGVLFRIDKLTNAVIDALDRGTNPARG